MRIINFRLSCLARALISNVSEIAGITFTREAIGDAHVASAVVAMMENEVSPTLLKLPPAARDEGIRDVLAFYAGNRAPAVAYGRANEVLLGVVLDCARNQIELNATFEVLAFTTAVWMARFKRSYNEKCKELLVDNPHREKLRALAAQTGDDVLPMMAFEPVFGDICKHDHFVSSVSSYFEQLDGYLVRDVAVAAVSASNSCHNGEPPSSCLPPGTLADCNRDAAATPRPPAQIGISLPTAPEPG